MAAASSVVTGRPSRMVGHEIALMSALYAWRWCRSVYLFEPALMSRLLTQVPDALTLVDVETLPEWCVYVYEAGAGLWMHLEHDMNTGRPELRLLMDVPGEPAPLPVAVYLHRETITESIGDFRATIMANLAGGAGRDVRGGELDAIAAAFAERVEAYLAVAAYLSREQADIGERGRPLVRPVRRRTLARGRTVWLVGYGSG